MLQPVKLTTPDGTLSVGIQSGNVPLQIHTYEGEHYVAGISGAPYSIVVQNLTSQRVEVVTSVDGRNTLKDEEADYTANGGLVLPPLGRYSFRGWRLDNAGVRDFIFGSDISDSVVAQAGGDTANAGVIGIAGWREKRTSHSLLRTNTAAGSYPRSYRASGPSGQSVPSWSSSESVPVASAGGATMDCYVTEDASDLSTGIGDYREDRVGTTTFTRGDGPDILVFRYMSYSRLVEKGIIVEPSGRPNPFPGSSLSGYRNMQPPTKRK